MTGPAFSVDTMADIFYNKKSIIQFVKEPFRLVQQV